MDDLPTFPYHPTPLATGVVEPSGKTCRCCGEARGFTYVGPVYSVEDLNDSLCPWCIGNGAAASKFDASFVDVHAFRKSGIIRGIVDQVCLRTPSYFAWQEPQWLDHCGDACAFQGRATISDIEHASEATIEAWERTYEKDRKDWEWSADRYEPSGHIGFYKFVCRHCDLTLFAWDLS
jgi:uncharacterized protein CbrC (UPF0167 family)